jgi:carbonic anhydrase/acetyltransferase-like protein (isoleucine patch superfamily)
MIISYQGKTPSIGKHVFIAPTAVIIGDVSIQDGASIWYGAVLRGDMASITIGEYTNIQDNATVHTDHGKPAYIGNRVSVGHNAVVHGCRVEDDCLIGISAVVLSGAKVHRGSVVASGAVVREGHEVGPNHLVAGAPALFKKELSKEALEMFKRPVQNYKKLAAEHMASLATELTDE